MFYDFSEYDLYRFDKTARIIVGCIWNLESKNTDKHKTRPITVCIKIDLFRSKFCFLKVITYIREFIHF